MFKFCLECGKVSSKLNCKVKKGKVVPALFLTKHHAMKAYWGSGCITARILNLGTRWRWVSTSGAGRFTPRDSAPGTQRIGGWMGSRAVLDTAVVKRKIPSPRRESNPRTPIFQPIAPPPIVAN
jgi:hypothetical protein